MGDTAMADIGSQVVKAVPSGSDITKFVMDTSFDAGKILLPSIIGGAVLGKPGVVLGAIAGGKWAGTNKAISQMFLGLIAIDLVGELVFGRDIIGAF